MEESDQLHAPAALLPVERAPGTHWVEAWVGPRAGLEAMDKRKSLTSARNRIPAVQPIARRYTDRAIQSKEIVFNK
jgi:hypothetical protein